MAVEGDLVATVNAANANSFGTIAEADTYAGNHLYATDWAGTNDVKATALIYGAMLMEKILIGLWKGTRTTSTQALSWARTGVYYPDTLVAVPTTTVPTGVKNCQFEFSRHLLVTNREAESSSFGISEIRVEPIEIKFADYLAGATPGQLGVIPPSAMQFIRPYLEEVPSVGGFQTALASRA